MPFPVHTFLKKVNNYYNLNPSNWVNVGSTNNIGLAKVSDGYWNWSQLKIADNYYGTDIINMSSFEIVDVNRYVANFGRYSLYQTDNPVDPLQELVATAFSPIFNKIYVSKTPDFNFIIINSTQGDIIEFRKNGNLIQIYDPQDIEVGQFTLTKPNLFLRILSQYTGFDESGRLRISR